MKINSSFNVNKILSRVVYFTVIILIVRGNQQLSQEGKLIHQISKEQTNMKENNSISSTYKTLNQQIESLDQQFLPNFINAYHIHKSILLQSLKDQYLASQLNMKNIKENSGNYLLLLSKMYLYNMLPKSDLTGQIWRMYQTDSDYMLAYFYLRVAAQKYENAEAYYYLALLDYYKLNPHQAFIKNLQKQVHRISGEQGYSKVNQLKYSQLLDHLRNQRFVSVEHNLFFSSVLGHQGASLVLANMYRQGLGMDKNCTTSLAYYLSIIKKTYVDTYEFRSSYSDDKNFQKQLYAKKKVSFENQENVDVVSSSEFFDSETIKTMYQLAENYFIGRGGFRKSYEKAAQLYAKLAAQDHKNSMAMLGMCYFKGQGVPLDRKRARVLFQHSSKVSISQAMLIVMDYFEIQSKGNRPHAIKKMKDIYEKKKEFMNPILKYLFSTLIIKGDLKQIKVDDAILLLGGAAKQGHLMAKISMGLLFADGIDINYDCTRAVNYFSEQGLSHPFFMDKFYMARFGLKNQFKTFSLIKYLQLSTVGDTNSFINALYILQIQKQASLGLNQNSWSLKLADNNGLYQLLKKQKVVPDIYTYLQNQFSFFNQKPIKFNVLQRLFEDNSEVAESHFQYIKKKIIKVCAITKQNSLMNFYEHKMSEKSDPALLNTISNGQADKLHVLQSRYLLGQFYHKKSFQSLSKGKDHTKQQYKALQEYKRATNSPILGKMLFYLQQVNLSPYGLAFQDQLFQFQFINDLLTFTFILSILIFILYYRRSKKLDQIHRKQLERRTDQARLNNEEESFKRRFGQLPSNQISEQEKQRETLKQNWQSQKKQQEQDENQPQIVQQRPKPCGFRIGGSDEQEHLVIRQVYKFEETQTQNLVQENDQNQNEQRVE